MQVTKENYQWFSHSDIITALQLFFYAYIYIYPTILMMERKIFFETKNESVSYAQIFTERIMKNYQSRKKLNPEWDVRKKYEKRKTVSFIEVSAVDT